MILPASRNFRYWLKWLLAVDTRWRVILAQKAHQGPVNDCATLRPLLDEVVPGSSIGTVLADAEFDSVLSLDAGSLEPYVTWGTNPGQSAPISGRVPQPTDETAERALRYMDLTPGTALQDIALDRVFIGSCTNARLEDLRLAASVVQGRHVHPRVRAMVVPGSASVKLEAEAEGLDRVFTDAGFEWRDAGCSMCLGMNTDILAPGERCASTSNRNFEGRQGSGGRTHLMSPPMAAAAAVAGHLVDVRELTR